MRGISIVAIVLVVACVSLECKKDEPGETVDAQLVLEAMEEMQETQGMSSPADYVNEFARSIADDNRLVLLDLKLAKSDIEISMSALTMLMLSDDQLEKADLEALSRFHTDLFAVSEASRQSYNEESGLNHDNNPSAALPALIETHEAAISTSERARTNLETLARSIDERIQDEAKRTLLQQTLSRCKPPLSSLEATLSFRVDGLRLAYPSVAGAKTSEANAIAAIERVGGKIQYDDEATRTKVMGIQFEGGANDDVMRHVIRFADIERLVFFHSRQITDESMIHIGQLRKLRVLSLYATGLTDRGLAALPQLDNLEWLALSACGITDAGLQTIGRIQSLRILDVSGTQITSAGLPFLKELRNLEELNIRGAALDDTSLQHLAHMISMKRLDLGASMATTGRLDQMAELISLNEKKVSAQSLSPAEQERLKELMEVETAFARRPRIGDDGLVHLAAMTQLEQITLSGTRVSDAGLDAIMAFKNLTYIDLGNTEVTDAGREKLRKALPKAYIR